MPPRQDSRPPVAPNAPKRLARQHSEPRQEPAAPKRLAPVHSEPRRRVAPIMQRLKVAIRDMELPAIEKLQEDNAATAFQTMIATLLSAQTRDAVTHAASLRLFARAPTPEAIAVLPTKTIERLIYPVSFYRNKARHLKDACRQVLDRFGGVTPSTMEELTSLPGVGRKTANLVMIVAHRSADNICVDTHVHRIANRFGWVETRTPEQTETALYEVAAKRWWADINLYLVTWGQQVCRPVYPRCGACPIARLCPRIGVTRTGRA